jgi:myo-inositol-1-phosphate synthase
MHRNIGGYTPDAIDVVAAFDIDRRKVGKDVSEAIFSLPNCTTVFCPDIPLLNTPVLMGPILDGVSDHMLDYDPKRSFLPADLPQLDKAAVVRQLKESGTEVLLNYLPVGSENASRFYADCAIDAGVAFVNNIPVFIASDSTWAERFSSKGIPIIGDDIKSQMGATITHRILTDLFKKRGVALDRTYQLNTGGNTDFLNMLNHSRLSSKKKSKTEAVQSVAAIRARKREHPHRPERLHPLAERQQSLFYPHGGAHLRRYPHEPGDASISGRLPEFGRCGHRHHSLCQIGP